MSGEKSEEQRPGGAVPGGNSLLESLRDRLQVEPNLSLQPPSGPEVPGDPGEPRPVLSGTRRYLELEVLGEGAFGKVYRVFDGDLKRELAMKVLKPRPGREPLDVKRFVEEAQATAQLEHPSIVPVHEVGADGDRLYYTMKLLRGRTLAQVFAKLREGDKETQREWSLTRLVQVFLQVCHAIHFAHARGVVHRDLKPQNIMLGDYGEVTVMDWGLAKVVVEGQVRTEGFKSAAASGTIVGSPSYMSPEQAAGETERVDAKSDVWALGVIFYEALTLTTPFASENAAWLLARILMEEPEPPRRRAPDRDIPLELERICLAALAKDPATRQSSAGTMFEQVQAWFEAEMEKSRRHQLAESKAAVGLQELAAYRRYQAELAELEREHDRLRGKFRPWQALAEKRELLDKAREIEATRSILDRAFGDAVAQFTTAVGLEAENRTARRALTELYWEKFLRAEAHRADRDMAFFRPLVELYHDGSLTRELRGDGSLTIDSNPAGAEVWLYQYHEHDLPLVPRGEKLLGQTPLGPLPLPMGSYLLVLRAEGYRDVHYPVLISRNRDWVGRVNLFTEAEIGPDYVYVPAGPFVQGCDDDSLTFSLPVSEGSTEDYFIARHPITMAEYLEFLNDLARVRPEEALSRSPRRHPEGGSYLVQLSDGRLSLPEEDAEGDRWEPRWPVIGVSWLDACAYCEWRSRRDGHSVRLPTDPEWEKAARGADGRDYPWGNRYDASLSNMKDSRRERPAPVTIDEFPTDLSPYGVRGMAGNVRDWTGMESDSGMGTTARAYFIIRGGCWGFGPAGLRGSGRFGVSQTLVDGQLGFRLARTPPAR